jgi:hypothetical protein
MTIKIAEIDNEIKAKIIADREKDYGDYQYNFIMLAEMFTLVLADHDMGIYNNMAFELHKKEVAKKDKT